RRARDAGAPPLLVVDHEGVDLEVRLDPIEDLEPPLEPREDRGARKQTRAPPHWGRPSPFGGTTPSAASRAAADGLPARCHERYRRSTSSLLAGCAVRRLTSASTSTKRTKFDASSPKTAPNGSPVQPGPPRASSP